MAVQFCALPPFLGLRASTAGRSGSWAATPALGVEAGRPWKYRRPEPAAFLTAAPGRPGPATFRVLFTRENPVNRAPALLHSRPQGLVPAPRGPAPGSLPYGAAASCISLTPPDFNPTSNKPRVTK